MGIWQKRLCSWTKMVEHPNQSQPNPGLRSDESPSSIIPTYHTTGNAFAPKYCGRRRRRLRVRARARFSESALARVTPLRSLVASVVPSSEEDIPSSFSSSEFSSSARPSAVGSVWLGFCWCAGRPVTAVAHGDTVIVY